MGIQEELEQFCDYYHQYVDTCEELAKLRDSYDALEAVGDDRYFESYTTDEVVVGAREFKATAIASVDEAQKNVSDEAQKAEAQKQQLKNQIANLKARIQAEEQKHREYLDANESAVGKAENAIETLEKNRQQEAAKNTFPGAIVGGLILIAMAAILFLFGRSLVGIYFVYANHLSVFLAACGILFLLINISIAKSNARRAANYRDIKVASENERLGLLGEEKSKQIARHETTLQELDTQLAQANEELQNLVEQTEHHIALLNNQVDDRKRFYFEHVAPEVDRAKVRSSALYSIELIDAGEELRQCYEHAVQLYDTLTNLQKNSPNLPLEEDWPLIDSVLNYVQRHRADTLKEALQLCTEEERHQQIIAAAAGIIHEQQLLRAQMGEQLDAVIALSEQRNDLLGKQLDELEEISSLASQIERHTANISSSQSRVVSAAREMERVQKQMAAAQLEHQAAERQALSQLVAEQKRATAVSAVNTAISFDTNRTLHKLID